MPAGTARAHSEEKHLDTAYQHLVLWCLFLRKVQPVHSIKSWKVHKLLLCRWGACDMKYEIHLPVEWRSRHGRSCRDKTLELLWLLSDTTHRGLSLPNNPSLASGKAPSRMIFVCNKPGHNYNSKCLESTQGSGFTAHWENLCRNLSAS